MWQVGSVHAKDLERPGAVYIGRGGKGLAASPLANPFRMDPSRPGAEQHADVLDRYRRWLWEQLKGDTPARREIAQLASLPVEGILVCFCRPIGRDAPSCHGDIVARAIEWYRTNVQRDAEAEGKQ